MTESIKLKHSARLTRYFVLSSLNCGLILARTPVRAASVYAQERAPL